MAKTKNVMQVQKPVDKIKKTKEIKQAMATKVSMHALAWQQLITQAEKKSKKVKIIKGAPDSDASVEKVKKSKKSKKIVEKAPVEDSSDSDSSEDEKMDSTSMVIEKEVADAESSSSSSESEEEKVAPKKVKGKAAPAPAKDASSSDDSSDSSSSDEEEEKVAPKKVKKVEKDASSSDDSSSESSENDDDSGSSSEEDEEMEDAKKDTKKRANEEVQQAETPKKMKSESSEGLESCVCFVGNLSWNLDEDSLAQVFAECGEVTSVRLITEKGTNRPKGYGYVEFSTPEAAKKALELTGQNVDGREIRVDVSTPRPPRDNNAGGRAEEPKSTPSATLFMGNLSFDCTEDIIRDTFAEYGTIMSVRLPTDRESGRPKGYVHF